MRTLEALLEQDLDYICQEAETELSAIAGHKLWLSGAAGFVGYYLTKAIEHWNKINPGNVITLIAVDNFIRGVPIWLESLDSEYIQLLKFDITKDLPVEFDDVDYVIHAASIASPPVYRQYPLETIDANITGIRNVLDRADKLKAILFFSTSEIYGDPPAGEIPTKETFRGLVSCTGPRACYDESKRLGETLCVIYSQKHDVPVKIVRPFNNYGPGLKITDGRVLPDFARNALDNEDIVMLSDGSPTRTFCYIADAVTGYLKVLIRGHQGEPYNIGIDNDETSMRDLALLVQSHARELWSYAGSVITQEPEESAYLEDNPNRRCPNIDKAREHLDYDPKIGIDQGVRSALEWYFHQENLGTKESS